MFKSISLKQEERNPYSVLLPIYELHNILNTYSTFHISIMSVYMAWFIWTSHISLTGSNDQCRHLFSSWVKLKYSNRYILICKWERSRLYRDFDYVHNQTTKFNFINIYTKSESWNQATTSEHPPNRLTLSPRLFRERERN